MNVRAPRTPKIKEFVHEPFRTCPDCGTDRTFGVLMICDRHYVRRCIQCWFDKSLPLPAIKKTIIYLDQFVLSNMMKELDPSKEYAHGFYRTLFEKLDRLSKRQLIVCPDSPIQDYESVVDTPIREDPRSVSPAVTRRRPPQSDYDSPRSDSARVRLLAKWAAVRLSCNSGLRLYPETRCLAGSI